MSKDGLAAGLNRKKSKLRDGICILTSATKDDEDSVDLTYRKAKVAVIQCQRNKAVLKKVNLLSTEDAKTLITMQAISEGEGHLQIQILVSTDMLENPSQHLVCGEPGCDKIIRRNSSWVKHFQTHLPMEKEQTQSTLFLCGVLKCSAAIRGVNKNRLVVSFPTIQGLRQHYRKCHASKKLPCALCKKTFSTHSYLKDHEAACGIRFQCDSCPKTFDSLETLRTHARRRSHDVDIKHYKDLIQERKSKNKTEKEVFNTSEDDDATDNAGNEKPMLTCTCTCTTDSTKSKRSLPRFVPILPRAPPALVESQNRPKTSKTRTRSKGPIQVQIGTQTVPQLVRKRSASRHCQTENKITKTTGTITVQTHEHSQSPKKRKTSAQTQTKKLKISTETQTPVVTKRQVSNRRRELSSTTTQTSPSKDISQLHYASSRKEVPRLFPKAMMSMLDEGLMSEVHIETQTDPNPFFGYPGSSSQPHDTQSDDSEEELGEGAKTIETQTSPRRRAPSDWGPKMSRPQFSFGFPLAAESSQREDTVVSPTLPNSPLALGSYYFETMDSETQTNFHFFDDD